MDLYTNLFFIMYQTARLSQAIIEICHDSL